MSLRAVFVARNVGTYRGERAVGAVTDGDVKDVVSKIAVIHERCGNAIGSSGKHAIAWRTWSIGDSNG